MRSLRDARIGKHLRSSQYAGAWSCDECTSTSPSHIHQGSPRRLLRQGSEPLSSVLPHTTGMPRPELHNIHCMKGHQALGRAAAHGPRTCPTRSGNQISWHKSLVSWFCKGRFRLAGYHWNSTARSKAAYVRKELLQGKGDLCGSECISFCCLLMSGQGRECWTGGRHLATNVTTDSQACASSSVQRVTTIVEMTEYVLGARIDRTESSILMAQNTS